MIGVVLLQAVGAGRLQLVDGGDGLAVGHAQANLVGDLACLVALAVVHDGKRVAPVGHQGLERPRCVGRLVVEGDAGDELQPLLRSGLFGVNHGLDVGGERTGRVVVPGVGAVGLHIHEDAADAFEAGGPADLPDHGLAVGVEPPGGVARQEKDVDVAAGGAGHEPLDAAGAGVARHVEVGAGEAQLTHGVEGEPALL